VAIDALVGIGGPAVERLSEVATDRRCSYERRQHAVEALGQIKSERAMKVLISLRDNKRESKKLRE
jgi:HEAT repeat protein